MLKSGFEKTIKGILKGLGVKHWYEPVKLPYVIEANYLPDFVVGGSKKPLTIDDLKGKILIEVKGHFDVDSRKKMIAVKKAHPSLDIRIVLQADQYLYKAKKGTGRRKPGCKDIKYSDWCIKHGFPYSIGEVPHEWFDT